MKFLPGLVACLCCVVACASDWTAFRGGAGDGHSAAKNLPSEWSQEKNIAWKIELPGAANGSPIIAGDRVLLTSATDKGTTRTLHCFSAADGSEQWKADVTYDREMPTHKTNLYGGTTPASDGKVVVVWHGSAGLY
ncbi:MAG TPA: serine/threonine protein kinase, partial [Planctomycetaceae bacterium]|nr:serine/threonine protein kinase [Planctomycetaceae bacterium]